MTKFQALYVKVLRLRMGYSYRAIAHAYFVRYVLNLPFNSVVSDDTNTIYSMQEYGVELCDNAMIILNEVWDEY